MRVFYNRIPYYWGKRDQTIYLEVDERGNIRHG
jgi:hypothetical protein